MPVNSRLKATKIISQREAIYRQIIPESICAKEETVNIGIFETSRNGDRKIIQSIRITRRPPSRIRKWNQLVQMNIYQSNTYRKDLSWLHFNNEPMVQERQQVKDQQSCISTLVAYPTIPSSN